MNDDITSNLKGTITAIDPPKEPRKPVAWRVFEHGPGDPPTSWLSYADLADTAEADTYRVYHHKVYEAPDHRGYTCIDVLPELTGKPWDAAALNLMQALRPSAIRVVSRSGAYTLDAHTWRVSVFLSEDDKTIRRISQEVEVGLRGCRYGGDVSDYLEGRLAPDGSDNAVMAVGNIRSIMKLDLYGGEQPTQTSAPEDDAP